MKTMLPATQLLVDGCHGIYVPKSFVTNFDLSKWTGITPLAATECLNPENEYYWECWDEILCNAAFSQNGYTWRLEQHGDLFAVCGELMTDEEKKHFGFID